MPNSREKKSLRKVLETFVVELIFYSVLVTGYFWATMHFLGNWVYHLFQHERNVYAFVALALIVAQGFLLELLTRALLAFSHSERRK